MGESEAEQLQTKDRLTLQGPILDAVNRDAKSLQRQLGTRDRLKLEMDQFNPTSHFPRDQQYAHMDNIGERLSTSGYLLERYREAAEAVIRKALPNAPVPAPLQTFPEGVPYDGVYEVKLLVQALHRKNP